MSKAKVSEEEFIRICRSAKSISEIASVTNTNVRSVQRRLDNLEPKYGDLRPKGHFPQQGDTSTLYDAVGDIKLQWVKLKQTKEQQVDSIKETINALTADIPKYKKTKIPKDINKDLLVAYPMGDPHIGMYAWAAECGDDFDTEIAERNLCEVTRRLVECAPPAETAVIINVGDFFHADSLENKTMRSGHSLDVDTRWPRVLWIGVRAMKTCIEYALKKHKKVKVINAIGNHDDHTSIALSMILNAYFEKEKRVEIEMNPTWFHYVQFGENLIGVTHGDKVKMADLPQLMATDKPKEWGDTKYRYWYTGHIHHDSMKEFNGCKVESFRTLAAKDAYTASHGYRSGRDMQCIIHHKEFGEIERHRINLDMIK